MQEQDMNIVQHLEELRRRIIITLFAFFIFFIVAFFYVEDIYKWFVKDLDMKLTILGPSEVLWIYFMIAALASVVATLPLAAYQLWAFVKPGLNPVEQKYTLLYIPALVVLFVAGLSFGYFVILPIILGFLTSLGAEMFNQMYTIQRYFSFVFNITIPFAVLFELPIVVMFLTSIGIVNPVFLQKNRRYAYFILIVIAIIISPPDFMSDFIVAVPLVFVYEVSVSCSRYVYRRKKKREQQLIEQTAIETSSS